MVSADSYTANGSHLFVIIVGLLASSGSGLLLGNRRWCGLGRVREVPEGGAESPGLLREHPQQSLEVLHHCRQRRVVVQKYVLWSITPILCHNVVRKI